jgi:hypothetical protein
VSDENMQNNLLATGALLAVLTTMGDAVPGFAVVGFPEEGPGNQLDVRFDFLKSPYRLTVERVIDDD